MPIDPNTLINGTVADADEVQIKFDSLFFGFDAVGGHKHTGAVGDAPKLGAAGIDLTANYPWTGLHTWSQLTTVDLGSGALPAIGAGTAAIFQNNTNAADNAAILIVAGTTGDSVINFGDSVVENAGSIFYDHNDDSLKFNTNGSTRVGITSSGVLTVTVGNGTAPAQTNGTTAVFRNNLNVGDYGRIGIIGGASAQSIIDFGDAADQDAGSINYDHTTDSFRLRINATADLVQWNSSGEMLLPNIDPPTANYGNRNSFVKAWASANAILVMTFDDSYNVASGARLAMGAYAVVWDTDFSNTGYAPIATVRVNAPALVTVEDAPPVGQCTFFVADDAGVPIDTDFNFIVCGAQ